MPQVPVVECFALPEGNDECLRLLKHVGCLLMNLRDCVDVHGHVTGCVEATDKTLTHYHSLTHSLPTWSLTRWPIQQDTHYRVQWGIHSPANSVRYQHTKPFTLVLTGSSPGLFSGSSLIQWGQSLTGPFNVVLSSTHTFTHCPNHSLIN